MGCRSSKRRGARARQRLRATATLDLSLEALEPRRLLAVNVLTYHNDLTRQGLNDQEAYLTPANVNTSAFGKLFSYPVAGQIYGEPLYVSNLAIPGQGVKSVVFVVTEHNDVYAFDAQSNAGPNAGLYWHVNLGPSAAVPNSFWGNRYGPYSDIKPQVGITSTPVIDLATNTMYIDSFTNDVPGQNAYSHHIWALDITTGQQKTAPVLVAAQVQGAEEDPRIGGAVVSPVTFQATQQLQRPALTLLNGTLYVPYAGYADTDPYHGWMLGFDATTLALTKVFNTTPNLGADANEGEGGIWQGGYGPASDGTRLYLMTGNGDFQVNIGDYGDSFLELTPDDSVQPTNKNGYGLSVTDYFTPFNEQSLAAADTDLGSGGAMLLPDQAGAHPHLLVGSGKQGTIYLIDRDNMGQFHAGSDSVVQKVNLGHSEFGGPAYFNNKIYYHANGDVLKAFSITNGVLSAAPVAQATASYSFPGATPSISAAGTANGIAWDVQYNSSRAVLRAYDATTLAELYNSSQIVGRDGLNPGVKFATPMIADGHVYVGTDGALAVFGLLAPPVTTPAPPTGLGISNSTAQQLRLTWTDNATNESMYKIERSTDGTNFSQLALASVNSTSYTDASVTPEVRYYYRVRAVNGVGESSVAGPVNSVAVAVATPTLIYHFDEGFGTLTADSAGSNTGTLVGATLPTWTAGRVGANALAFSGDGVPASTTAQSAVQAASSLAGTLGSTATLTAWIKTTQTGSDTVTDAPAITGFDRQGVSTDVRWGTIDASGRIGVSAGNAGIVSSTAINDGQWHHVALTRNATNGALQIYIDGVLRASGTSITGAMTTAFRLIGAQSTIAADGTTFVGATYFNGALDDVRIYSRVLTAAEIATIAITPMAPTALAATALSGSIVQLSWVNNSSFAENVQIERKTGAGGTYQQIAQVAGTATTYTDTGRTPGTEYFYRVRASDLAGSSAYSGEANVTPPRPEVVGRYAFYNKSGFDGQNGSSNIADNLAIATDKQALLPGETASFANYTSYTAGLNGVIIDVSNFDGVITPADFTLLVGNSNDVDSWEVAPTPDFISMYPGWGVGGTTRLEIVWENNGIENEWLQVTLKANAVTNLLAPDVFYFGNAIGESGNSATSAAVDSADELLARANGTAVGAAAITSPYDYNRDKTVDVQDQLAARAHRSGLAPLVLITAPAATVAAAASWATSAVSAAETLSLPVGAWIAEPLGLSSGHAAKAQVADAALANLAATGPSRVRSIRFGDAPVGGGGSTSSFAPPASHDSASAPPVENHAASATNAAFAGLGGSGRVRRLRFGGAVGLLLALVTSWSSSQAASVVVGNHLLSANTPNQTVSLWITGGEAVAGEDFFAQIGDGGVFVGGSNTKPAFASVDILGGGIFAGNNNGAFGDPNGAGGSNAAHPLVWVDGTTTAAGTVSASGVLATLKIDTTGIAGGTFPLVLSGVGGALGSFSTGLVDGGGAPVALSITNGTLKIAPGLTADFNENGTVSGADLALWSGGFGTLAAATHLQGDATGEGVVDGADLLIWQRQTVGAPALAAMGAVPEPAAALLTMLAAAALPTRRKQHNL